MDGSERKEYPPRLYGVENSPDPTRSLNHASNLHFLLKAKPMLGDDVWDAMKESSLGCIVSLAENNFTWCAKTVHYFLTHQLEILKPMEIWSLLGDNPLRFSLHEFARITGLDCGPYEHEGAIGIDPTELWGKMELSIGDGPHWNDLNRMLKKIDRATWSFPERRSVGFMCLIAVGVFGFQRGSRMEFKYAKKALDPIAFKKYPWGCWDCVLKSQLYLL